MIKNLLPFLLCLASCRTGGHATPPPRSPDLRILSRSQLTVDVPRLKEGQWVRYAVRITENAPIESVTFSVVKKTEEGAWIENRISGTGASGTWIVKSHYSPEGELREQWVGEPGAADPVRVFPGKERKPVTRKPGPEISFRRTRETVTVAGHVYDTRKITTTHGETTLTNWCAEGIPFPAVIRGRSQGGVVKRIFGGFTMELAAHGTDAKEELPLP
jgi:hypothetical protein